MPNLIWSNHEAALGKCQVEQSLAYYILHILMQILSSFSITRNIIFLFFGESYMHTSFGQCHWGPFFGPWQWTFCRHQLGSDWWEAKKGTNGTWKRSMILLFLCAYHYQINCPKIDYQIKITTINGPITKIDDPNLQFACVDVGVSFPLPLSNSCLQNKTRKDTSYLLRPGDYNS